MNNPLDLFAWKLRSERKRQHLTQKALLCGLPFGIHRMCVWIVPGGGSLGGGIALFALNFIIGGVIGGFVLAWRLIVAVWYVPLTVYRLIVG